MKKVNILILFFCIILCFEYASLKTYASVPIQEDMEAKAAILMDAETGQVLYEKNANQKRSPASITKILTAIIALETLDKDTVLTTGKEAAVLPAGSATIRLEEGEKLTVEEAMYALMLRSANEVANILAEEVSGSQEDFAEVMNRRAIEIGAASSQFANPHGLPEQGHYTTAYDMALMTKYALEVPDFCTYFGTTDYAMNETNLSDSREFLNTHRMLLESYDQYNENVVGGKTGYTTQAGYTLVTVAERDNRTLICVILNSDTMYADTLALLDFGFEEFVPYRYTFTGTEELVDIDVLDENNNKTGQCSFSGQSAINLLLHISMLPENIVEDYRYPQILKNEEDAKGQVELRIPSSGESGLPTVLMSIPLTVEITEVDIIDETEEEQNVSFFGKKLENGQVSIDFGTLYLLFIIVPVLIVILGLIVNSRYKKAQRYSRVRACNQREVADHSYIYEEERK